MENSEKKYVDLQLVFIAGGAMHNLKCWLCKKNPAVYSMNPVWVFEPCWKCQEEVGGKVFRVRNRFLIWLLSNK